MNKFKNIIYYFLVCLFISFGIFLRTKAYIFDNVFEDDECRLIVSMMANNIWQMFEPLGPWSSSPLFMFISKIIADFSDYSERALKFLPYVTSLISIIFFYKLSLKMFTQKASRLFALFLFASSMPAIFFSATFKQYELELLIGILCLYYLPEINILKLNTKQLVTFSFILAILPLISLPSVFYIGTFVLINICINKNHLKELFKKVFVLLSPFIIIITFYYLYNLAPAKAYQMAFYKSEWNNFYSLNLLDVFANNLKYFFWGCNYVMFLFILLITSVIIVCTNKNQQRKIDIFIIILFASNLLAQILHLYPFMGRIVLHLIPAFVYLTVKPLESFNKNSLSFYVILLIALAGFHEYFIPQKFLENVYYYPENMVFWSPDKLMKQISENFSPKNDKILVNEASVFSYYVYAKKYNIPDYLNIKTVIETQEKEKSIADAINNIEQNKNYWLYIVKDFSRDQDAENISKWADKQTVKFYMKDKSSTLYYIVPPYTKY